MQFLRITINNFKIICIIIFKIFHHLYHILINFLIMEFDILKEISLYLKSWKRYYKYYLIILTLSFILSIFGNKKYTTSFSFYQKDSSSSFGIIQSFTSLDSETLPLSSLVNSKQLYIYLASKKWEGKNLWNIFEIGDGLRSKIVNNIFYSNISTDEINFDKTVLKLQEDVITIRENSEDNSITIYVETGDKILSQKISNEIILFVNNYYSNIINESALQKTNFINQRIKDIEYDIDNIRTELISFKERNKNIQSPKLLEELKMLESDLLLKSQVYVQLYSTYETKLLESIDKSNAVFLITDVHTLAKHTSPDLKLNLLLSFLFSFLLTFILSIKRNNHFKLNVL